MSSKTYTRITTTENIGDNYLVGNEKTWKQIYLLLKIIPHQMYKQPPHVSCLFKRKKKKKERKKKKARQICPCQITRLKWSIIYCHTVTFTNIKQSSYYDTSWYQAQHAVSLWTQHHVYNKLVPSTRETAGERTSQQWDWVDYEGQETGKAALQVFLKKGSK